MKKLLLATNNRGKIKEIKYILKDLPFSFLSLKDVGITSLKEESGKSFEENALQKAKEIGDKTGFLSFADDSGLEIESLGGKPGIHSARYIPGSDRDRLNKVISEMKGMSIKKRGARFVSVVAIYDPRSKKEYSFRGEAYGYITAKPQGENGFGYDPIFFSKELGKTFGQATDKEKALVSHRARAIQKCKRLLIDNASSFC